MNEVQKGPEQADDNPGAKKYFRVHDRISHLVGVLVFYAVVFVIISVLSAGLKLFSSPEPVNEPGSKLSSDH